MTDLKTEPAHLKQTIGVTDLTPELEDQDGDILLEINAAKGNEAVLDSLKLANDGHVCYFSLKRALKLLTLR
jgi:hypothetical protein